MHLFWYAFAILYIPFAFYWFFGNLIFQPLSFSIIEFLAKWFTLYGIFSLIYGFITSAYTTTLLSMVVILSWLLSFLFLFLSMLKFGFTWRTLFAYIFVFPYYWIVLSVQAFSLFSEVFSRKIPRDKWDK